MFLENSRITLVCHWCLGNDFSPIGSLFARDLIENYTIQLTYIEF